MRVIGITGGVATGKTTVARILSSFLKAEIIDADEIVHKLLSPGEEAWGKVVQHFGKDILKESSYIDRNKLGKKIFGDTSKRKKLESIIHPAVKEIIKDKLKQFRKNEWIIMDIPLIYEAKMEHMMDKIIVVARDGKLQLKTLQKEKNLSLKEAKQRVQSQLPLSEKVKSADFVIYNNGTLKNTEKQIKEICHSLKSGMNNKAFNNQNLKVRSKEETI